MAESDGTPSEDGGSADEALHEDVQRPQVSPEHFGKSILVAGTGGSSRWFRGEPFVTRENVAPEIVRWMCPMTDCGGEMRDTGREWVASTQLVGTSGPGHHHECDRCLFTAAIRGPKYPRIEYPEL